MKFRWPGRDVAGRETEDRIEEEEDTYVRDEIFELRVLISEKRNTRREMEEERMTSKKCRKRRAEISKPSISVYINNMKNTT